MMLAVASWSLASGKGLSNLPRPRGYVAIAETKPDGSNILRNVPARSLLSEIELNSQEVEVMIDSCESVLNSRWNRWMSLFWKTTFLLYHTSDPEGYWEKVFNKPEQKEALIDGFKKLGENHDFQVFAIREHGDSPSSNISLQITPSPVVHDGSDIGYSNVFMTVTTPNGEKPNFAFTINGKLCQNIDKDDDTKGPYMVLEKGEIDSAYLLRARNKIGIEHPRDQDPVEGVFISKLFVDASLSPEVGFHELEVEVTLGDGSVLRKSLHFEVRQPQAYIALSQKYIIEPPRNFGRYGDLTSWSWINLPNDKYKKYEKIPTPESIREQDIDFWIRKAIKRPLSNKDRPFNFTLNKGARKDAKAWILFEPTLEELKKLDNPDDANLTNRIEDGLHLVIVGPPAGVTPADVTALPWLKFQSKSVNGATTSPVPANAASSAVVSTPSPQKVFRDVRIYFVTDNSRKSIQRKKLLAPREKDYAPIHAQKDIIEAIYAGFPEPGATASPTTLSIKALTKPYGFFNLILRSPERPLYSDLFTIYPFFPIFCENSSESDKNLYEQHDKFARSINVRLGALFVTPGNTHTERQKELEIEALDPNHLYPNTAVIIFKYNDNDSDTSGGMKLHYVTGNGQSLPYSPQGGNFSELLEGMEITPFEINLSAISNQTAARAEADKIINSIKDWKDETLEWSYAGRTIDPRTQKKHQSPKLHYILERVDDSYKFRNAARTLKTDRHREEEDMMIHSIPYGKGQVTFMAYSPLSEDMYYSDSGLGHSQKLSGWGIQRLIDATYLTPTESSGAPKLIDVRLLPDRSTVDLTLSVPHVNDKGGQARTLPELELELGDTTIPLKLIKVDPFTQHVTYRGSTSKENHGAAGLWNLKTRSNGNGSGRSEIAKNIYLDLRESHRTSHDTQMMLEQICSYHGGKIENNTENADAFKSCSTSVNTLASYCLLGLAGLLLSPLGRRWTLLIFLKRRKKELAAKMELPQGNFDVPTILTEWGQNPGPPKSGMQAGIPAGERTFQKGDSLQVAKMASLLPFVETPLELPHRLPTIRLRHLGAAANAVILLNTNKGMEIPRISVNGLNKKETAIQFVHLIAGFVWQRGGLVSIGRLNAPAVQDQSGPWGAGSEAELEKEVTELFKLATQLVPVTDEICDAGSVCYIVSDLVSFDDDYLKTTLDLLCQNGVDARLACVYDPTDTELFGLTYNVTDSIIHDRTEWTKNDMAIAYRKRAEVLQENLEQSDGRFVMLTCGEDAAALTEAIKHARFFD